MTPTEKIPNPPYAAFARHLEAQDRSPVTVRGYVGDLMLFARWAARQGEPSSFSFSAITPAQVQAYRQWLLEQGAKPQTINRRLAALAAYGQWAVQRGWLQTNPAQHVRSVATSRALAPRWLDKNQRSALVRAVEKDVQSAKARYPRLWVLRQRDAAAVLLLLHTGLRLSELCALRLADIQLSERKGLLTVRAGKGLKQRTIPLNASARQAAAAWLEVRPQAATDALFTGQRSRKMDPAAVQRAVTRAAAAAHLSQVTPHVLRHTFAKTLLDEGVSLEKVAALLGHSNLNTTRIYTAPGEEDLEEAVGRMVE